MSTAPQSQARAPVHPSWLLWGGEPLPAYVAPLLAAVAERVPLALPEGRVFCPDGLAFGPQEASFEHAVVAVTDDLHALAASSSDDPRRARLTAWIAAGASLLVPTRTAAGLLATAFRADRSQCHAAALPLPDPTVLPPVTPLPGGGLILVDRPIWQTLYPYLRALRLAGCSHQVVLAADDAGPHLTPGGDVSMADLVPGVEVTAVLDRATAVAQAAVIVRSETRIDAGWRLRECLASGRPLVVNGDPVVQDHLEAVGAAAYIYSGPDLPLQAAEATIAALARTRGPLHEAARAAVLAESWAAPAAVLARLLEAGPQEPERRTTATVGAVHGRPGLRVAVIAPHHRSGSAERFLREIVSELALHPSRPAITLYCAAAGLTAAARATAGALAENGGRCIEVGDEGMDAALAAHAGEIDVVWCTWPHRELPPSVAAPLVTTFHDLHWRFFWTFLEDEVREIESQMPAWLSATALFVSSSEFIRGQLCEQYEVERARTRVVPLTGMRPLPVSRAAAAAVRRRYSLPRRFLLFPAVRSPHKNHMALQRALERLRARGRPMSVVTTAAETDAWFHGPDMIGLGYVGDDTLRALYELSDGLVTPTLYEAGSFPVFEAMMVGRPVACSRIPPLVEQLERDGAVAELFDPNDPDDIAAALLRLRGMNPLKRARVVRHNRSAVGRRSWADVADGYMRVFAEALATRAPAAAVESGEP